MLFWNRLIVILRPPATAICLYALMGCWSPKQAINDKAIEVGQLASSSGDRFDNIDGLASSSAARFDAIGDSEGALEQQEIQAEAQEGLDEQADIGSYASGIRSDLHGVEDSVPWWAMLTGRLLWVVGGLAVLFFLWRSGLLGLIKKVIWGVGLFIPSRSIREAELDIKIMDADSEVTIREGISAKRASDPAYSAAYKQAKRKNA